MRDVQVSPKHPAYPSRLRVQSPAKASSARRAHSVKSARWVVLAAVVALAWPAGALSEGEGHHVIGVGAKAHRPGAAPMVGLSPSESAHRTEAVQAIRQVFGVRAPAAIRVASCETGGTFDPRALGRAGERGIFQIHPVHFSWASPRRLFEPLYNARVAFRLSRGGTSWRAWTCRWAA